MLNCKTHTLFFSSHLEVGVHQVGTLSVQLGVESNPVGWYREATSILLVIFRLICPRQQTVADATAQIAELFHRSFFCSGKVEAFETFDEEHTTSLYPPSVPTLFPTCKHYVLKTRQFD